MDVLGFLLALGLVKDDDEATFHSRTGYSIRVRRKSSDWSDAVVDYGPDIKVAHKGCLGLEKPENLVVLECVQRLLEKGYPPASLELETTWKLGHNEKGRLDILIKHRGKSFAMIECKTWGEEYAKERDNLLEDGGQLLSYFVQDRAAKALVLYSSTLQDGEIVYKAEGIDTRSLDGSDLGELFENWSKSLIPDPLFHRNAAAYFLLKANLRKQDLRDLDRETGSGLFHSFLESLRRQVVSDKPNAFNKIFNLFVCKIYDEDTKADTEELDFQWKTADTNDSLLERLVRLYTKGLADYLGIEIDDDHFSGLAEFSFVDVFDEESFERNAAILREVVELLQIYRIKYSGKHQFLGDFFESLLATGIKQEAGQFFTPTPLARFILRSLPLEEIIERKVKQKERKVLPYLIDFACGSGHFLTEGIDELNPLLDRIDEKTLTGAAKSDLLSTKNNYRWAAEYVYGIDKDYRLAKTTKIALFLNGDGDATIINGDGLDDFYHSLTYSGRLKTKHAQPNNETFDVLVANPPFCISGFKRYVKRGASNFRLFPLLTSKSTEIECLFIERMAQLLKPKAVAGIILPLSILNNTRAIYTEARKLLLARFKLRGMVELRDKTFIATPTSTVILFLEKREPADMKNTIAALVGHSLQGKNSPKCKRAIEQAREEMPSDFPDDKDWKDLLKRAFPNKGDHSYIDTTALPPSICLALIYLMLSAESTVLAFSGESKHEQERFLGYWFSRSRGDEGIHIFRHNGILETLLYDLKDRNNSERISSHLRASFREEHSTIPESLARNLTRVNTGQLVSGDAFILENPSTSFITTADIRSLSPLGDFIDDHECQSINFGDLIDGGDIEIVDGLTYKKKLYEVPTPTTNKVLTADNIDLKTGTLVLDKLRYLREGFEIPKRMYPHPGDIIVSKASGSLSHLGKCCLVTERMDAAIGGFLFIIRCKDISLVKAILYRMWSLAFRQFVAGLKDQNINNLTTKNLLKFAWKLPKDRAKFLQAAKIKEAART